MSGFDNLMRTDQHNAQVNQFYDQQRYQSDRATGQAIAQIPGNMQRAQMNQQAMEQQQLQGALMEKQVEADLRAQEVVMEQQLHKNKMATALMFDDVSRSRLNVRATELDVQARELELQQKRNSIETEPQSRSSETIGRFVGQQGVGALAKLNLITELTPQGWKVRKPSSPKELEEFKKNNPVMQRGAVDMMREGRMQAKDAAEQAARETRIGLDKAKLAAEVQKTDPYTGAALYSPAVTKQVLSQIGLKPASGGAASSQPTVDNVIDTYAAKITNPSMAEPDRRRLAATYATNYEQIRAIYEMNAPANRKVARTPEQFGDFVAMVLSDPEHPKHEIFLNLLNTMKPRR